MNNLPHLPFGYDTLTQKEQEGLTAAERLDLAEYTFYSGNNFTPCDMRVIARSPLNGTPILLGTLAMLSYSIHRDKFPVVSLGVRGTRGFTKGHRTIAGSLSFQSVDTDAFVKMTKAAAKSWGRADSSYILADELPPFDVIVTAINEEGGSSIFGLFGLTLLDFGTSFALDQLIPNETYSFAAAMVSAPRSAYETTGKNLGEDVPKIVRTAMQADKALDNYGNFETIIFGVGKPLVTSSLTRTELLTKNQGNIDLPSGVTEATMFEQGISSLSREEQVASYTRSRDNTQNSINVFNTSIASLQLQILVSTDSDVKGRLDQHVKDLQATVRTYEEIKARQTAKIASLTSP